MIGPQVKQYGWEEISVPLIVQHPILAVWVRLLTSAFGVFSVCINMVRTAPARTCVRNLCFKFNESIRGLDRGLGAVKVVEVVCR